jgi:hypothetical protein
MTIRNALSALAGFAIATTAVSAQTNAPVTQTTSIDARWNAWYGCWRPEAVDGVSPPSHSICILPSSNNAVSIATVVDGKIVSEQPIVADGSRRQTDEGGCKGFEAATWSQDQRRIFLTSDLNCGGSVQRKSTGVLALISPTSYVDVQTVSVGGESASRTVRYVALRDNETPTVAVSRLVDQPLARESARISAAAPLDFDDVVEASRVVGAETTDGLLVARRTGFQLNASRLRSLVASGVQPATIDVMVGLTYPEHFQVAEEAPRAMNATRASDAERFGYDPRYIRNSCYDGFGMGRYNGLSYDPYAMGYARCGFNSSYYSPFGYDAIGWGYGTGNVIVLSPTDGDKADVTNGTVVKGKGYTRRNAATGTARPRDASTTTTTSTSTTRSTGSSSGTVRSTGSSGSTPAPSSSGTSTGRTAKPKGGGGL